MKTGFRWLIGLSGIYDLLIGAVLIATTSRTGAQQPSTWLLSMMAGGFLLFCGAVLLWAAQDIERRGSVIFWQGLLRLFAVIAIFHAIGQGYLTAENVASSTIAAVIDALVCALYAVALLVVWRLSPWQLLLGRRN